MDDPASMNLFGRDSAVVIAAPSVPPYTTPALTANLVMRVFLAILANAVCLVPLRLLSRNGELAAAVFIVNVEVLNLETVVNSLIWRNDDVQSWWPGHGLCDVDAYIHNAAMALYVTCLLAIMRNLAQQVSMLRANSLTVHEKRRRNLIQALIMLPLPVVQLALTWPVTAQRFQVGTMVGCSWIPHPSWPNLVFFVLAPVVVALITGGYAVLTFFRFRQVSKTTETALSSNRAANRRSQRTKRRLYMMVISILVPFLPIVVALAVVKILNKPGVRSYDYNSVHHHATPLPWNTIVFYPSSMISWVFLNNCYISILTAIPIFLFFGTTKDAVNQYRSICLSSGMGRVFPRLSQEYDPDGTPCAGSSFGSSRAASMGGSQFAAAKIKYSASSRQFDSLHSSSTGGSQDPRVQVIDFAATPDLERGQGSTIQRPEPAVTRNWADDVAADPAWRRNPFPFRTCLKLAVPFGLSGLRGRPSNQFQPEPTMPLEHFASRKAQPRVCSDDEARLFDDISPTREDAEMPQIGGKR